MKIILINIYSYTKILLSFCIFLISCSGESTSTKHKKDIAYDNSEKLNTLNENVANNHVKQFNAITDDDSTITFTYQLQEKIEKENRPIGIKGFIRDIIKKDSNYFLIIYGIFNNKKCLSKLQISSKQLYEMFALNIYEKNGLFIFNSTAISSSSLLSIESELSDGGTLEDISSSLRYNFHNMISVFRGTLIDYSLDRKELPVDDN